MRKRRDSPGMRFAATLAFFVASGLYAAPWPLPEATLRFDVEVTEPPSEPAAGVLVILPDGGLLPGHVPVPVVLDDNARPLPSLVVWQNRARGLAVVFTPPPSKRAAIYVRGAPAAPTLAPSTDLRPSLLLYTREGNASLESAVKFGQSAPWGSDGVMGTVPAIGQRQNLYGEDGNYVSYYSGWFRREKADRIYFCTISDDGSELRVDGAAVAKWPGIHVRGEGAKGQFGRWIDVGTGLHRIEYFYFQQDGDQEAQAAWKTGSGGAKEIPTMIPAGAYLHSGRAAVRRAAFRDGKPAAAITGNTQPVTYFWFDKRPVGLFRFGCDLTDGNGPETSYTWTLGAECSVSGKGLTWLVEGCASARTLCLTASNRFGVTSVTAPIECWDAPRRAHIRNAVDLRLYREAFLGMCRAIPKDKDPCAKWTPELWTALVNVCEPFSGQDVLGEVFERARNSLALLPRGDRWYLQDVFIGGLRGRDPDAAAHWVERFFAEERDAARRFRWKNEAFDLALYCRNDSAAARTQVGEMRKTAVSEDDKLVAQIRLGDVERAAGSVDEATRLYSGAQDRYREMLRAGDAPARTAGPTAEAWTRGDKKRTARTNVATAVARAPDRDWKVAAMRQASFYSTVSALVKDDRFFEAREKLRQWEIEFPLGKLSSEYSLSEAEYFMAASDFRRALAGLQLYRRSVEVSDSLPDIMGLELKCLGCLNRPTEAAELARTIVKRFPNHPMAALARPLVESAGKAK